MKGKYEAPVQKKNSKKGVALLLVLFLMIGCVVGATFAWLTDSTAEIKNTFTAGMVDIELNESTGNQYKLVPGQDINKDPKVTVKVDSEACWVFVKIEEANSVADFITYTAGEGWIKLTGVDGVNNVYYRQQDALTGDAAVDAVYSVLAGDKVSVKPGVTTDALNAIDDENRPALSFTAYAIQQDDAIADAAAAWDELNP